MGAELTTMVIGLRWYLGHCRVPMNILSDSTDAIHAAVGNDSYFGPESVVLNELRTGMDLTLERGLFYISRD